MKLFLTNEKFMPSAGNFEFEPINKQHAQLLTKFSVKHEYFVNLIQDEIESYKLAKFLDTTIPLFSLTWDTEMYNNWDFDKDTDKNLFDNKIICPQDKIIISRKNNDNNYEFMLASFFGGPFPEQIAAYLFESSLKKHNETLDMKTFLKICFNNAMELANEYSKVTDGINKLDLGTPEEFVDKFKPEELKEIINKEEEEK